VYCSSRKKVPAPPAVLQLQNRLSALEADKGLGILSHEASELTEPEPHSSSRRKQQVTAVGRGSLPWGMEAPIGLPDLLSREVCHSSGAQLQDIVERLPNLVYSPRLLCPAAFPHGQQLYCQWRSGAYQARLHGSRGKGQQDGGVMCFSPLSCW